MNDPALEYLEADLDIDTATARTFEATDFRYTVANGNDSARHYVRPIFQLVTDRPGGNGTARYPAPCPDCDDFARSWNCATHPERRLDLYSTPIQWQGFPGPRWTLSGADSVTYLGEEW
jgi:hypothetical protein